MKVWLVAVGAAYMLTGCSAASSLRSLKIDGLKDVEFGETLEQVRGEMAPFKLLPGQPQPDSFITYSCDGLSAVYDGVAFSPSFMFRKGKLIIIKGNVTDPDSKITRNLQSDLSSKLGSPQINPASKLWTDGGVKIVLESRSGDPNRFEYVDFESSER